MKVIHPFDHYSQKLSSLKGDDFETKGYDVPLFLIVKLVKEIWTLFTTPY